ncbi:MAG: hypothetical protein IT361_16605 [Gemmatimonadaceae bacterium]|nr:hypothetical protein [Gemmatimonadaceae bacterium]
MSIRKLLVLGLIGAAACGERAGEGNLSADLKRDLDASANPIELASQGNEAPMRFVSELEQGKTAEPVQRSRRPRPTVARTAGTTPQDLSTPAPEVKAEIMVAQTTEASVAPSPAPAVSSVPLVAPRPAALPVEVPAEGGRGTGGGGIGTGDSGGGIGIGDVIGVVIRGGGVGPDHCPPRRRPRGRLPR